MGTFIIEGGHRLSGAITPQGAKNEALQILSAVLLTADPVRVSNVPEILDIKNLIELLREMGVKVTRHEKGEYTFQADAIERSYVESAEFVTKCASLRGSVMISGPMLSRFGETYFPKPGGDKIGRRRVDTHIEGFVKLGATYEYDKERRAYHLLAPKGLKG